MKHKLVEIFNKLKFYVQTHRRQSIAIGGLLLLLLIFIIGNILSKPNEEVSRTDPNTSIIEDEPEVVKLVPSPLTGVQVTEEQANRPVTAIIIENSPDARPQSSLHKAGFVFESIAEGGITRYVAFYQEARPDPIGPVRSLRPYFNDWIMTMDASIAHVGGSVAALADANSSGLKDLDQFSFGNSYYRTTDRFAPHNVYTDFELIDALNKQLGYTSSDFDSWPRKNPKPVAVPKASKITVNISGFTYRSSYTWDKATNKYKRNLAGVPDKDRESGARISPSVVIVIEAQNSIAQDGRYSYDLVGSGKATIFQDGNAQVGTWSKDTRSSQMSFTGDGGNAIKLNPGQVWMTALNPTQEVEFSP